MHGISSRDVIGKYTHVLFQCNFLLPNVFETVLQILLLNPNIIILMLHRLSDRQSETADY